VEVVEGQLAWLVYIVAAVVGGHSWSSSQVRAQVQVQLWLRVLCAARVILSCPLRANRLSLSLGCFHGQFSSDFNDKKKRVQLTILLNR
jgi:hypothetical protein